MNKVSRLGMLFNEGNVPDFGSIQMKSSNTNIYYLLAQDIPKLNGMLTKATSAAYLPEGQFFNFYTGALAFVVDYKTAGSGKIYAYHRGQDHWYEFNIRSDLGIFDLMWNRHERILRETKTISGTPPLTFKSNGRPLKNYRIYGNTVNGESVGNLVTEGEHTGEYCVPVTITNGTNIKTTNIYLSEKIRKVGDEFEYIDYKEQKFHRVRKNMFNNNGASVYGYIDSNGCLVESNYIKTYDFVECIAESNYTIKAFSTLNAGSNYAARVAFYDSNNNFISRFYSNAFPNGFVFHTPVNCAYFILSIDESIISNIMLVKGSTIPETYEAYIENTELNVTLPKLPTFSGKNTLSVGTTVSSSIAELTGKIKKVT